MSENMLIAFQITVIGMGLVFAAIMVLWGLMAVLVRIAPERTKEDSTIKSPPADDQTEGKRRAAAIAVAVALAHCLFLSRFHRSAAFLLFMDTNCAYQLSC